MRRDGDWRWIEGVGKNLMDDPGVGAIVTTFRDVTERVNAERDLKSSLELLQKVDAERRDLMARLVNAQEEERERIAMDIHDESIQVMTAVSMRLEVLQRHLTDPAQADACRQLQDSVRRCIASLRELIFEVHPHALEQYGLVSSLSQLLAKAAREVGLEYDRSQKLSGEPAAEVRLVVYRIAQEALTNVLTPRSGTEAGGLSRGGERGHPRDGQGRRRGLLPRGGVAALGRTPGPGGDASPRGDGGRLVAG